MTERILYVSADPGAAIDAGGPGTVEAASSAEALERLDGGGVDCVVSDVPVPGSDAVEFVESVRALDPAVPIFLVGNPDRGVEIRPALDAGATAHVEAATPELLDHFRRVASGRRTGRASEERRERIEDVVRETVVALTGTASREEVLDEVHRRLVDSDLYRFVRIGECDGGEIRLRRPAHGTLDLEEFASLVGCESGAFIRRATDDGAVEAVPGTPDFRGASAAAPAGDGPARREQSTCIALPLGDAGVAVVVSEDPPPLDGSERTALEELGTAVEGVLSATERGGTDHEQFARLLAHEFRNPLGVAKASLELGRQTDDPALLDRAEEALREMDRVVDAVLALATLDGVESTERCELATVATEAWSALDSPGTDLAVESTAGVEADRDLLVRLLSNLFRNAVEHSTSPRSRAPGDALEHGSVEPSPEDGTGNGRADPGDGGDDATVRVGTFDGGFYVEDDGDGVPPGLHEQVFEWGFSADGGTGIGLSVVGEVVDRHGWTIEVADAPDGGARFEVLHGE